MLRVARKNRTPSPRARCRRPGATSGTAGALAATLALALCGCTPDRLRPGPPSLVIEVSEGNVVFSPDTIGVTVRASDPNGLDVVEISLLGRTEQLNAFERVEVEDTFIWSIPAGLTPGELIPVNGLARDLVGEETRRELSVTVIARSSRRAAPGR